MPEPHPPVGPSEGRRGAHAPSEAGYEKNEAEFLEDFLELAAAWSQLRKYAPPKIDELVAHFNELYKIQWPRPPAARRRIPDQTAAAFHSAYAGIRELLPRYFAWAPLQAAFRRVVGIDVRSMEEAALARQLAVARVQSKFKQALPTAHAFWNLEKSNPQFQAEVKAAVVEATDNNPDWPLIVRVLRILPGEHHPLFNRCLAKGSDYDCWNEFFESYAAPPREKSRLLEVDPSDEALLNVYQAAQDADVLLKRLASKAAELPEAAPIPSPAPKDQETPETKDLIQQELQRLTAFFGQDIKVPALPPELTPGRIQELKEKGFDLHYLPAIDMTLDQNFPGWKKKPNYQYLDQAKLPPGSTLLPGCWVAIDARDKPAYQNGLQMYANDGLSQGLQELNARGVIKQRKYDGTPLPPATRYGLSPQDLENPHVKEAFAKALGVSVDQVSTPREIDFNFLGNAHYPQWDTTDTSEWFSDQYDTGRGRLLGGRSDRGGLSHVGWLGPGGRGEVVGFRLLVRFSF